MTVFNWQQVVEKKRAATKAAVDAYLPAGILEKLPSEDVVDVSAFVKSLLTPSQLQLVEGELDHTLSLLRSGKISATDITKLYITNAAIAHQLCNAITEPNFDAAVARAAELDAYRLKNGPIGPLHGLPITLKDQFKVTGLDTTISYVSLAGKPATDQSALVDILESLGAIIIAKTTLPQSIMWCETESPMFGLTTNPRNRKYTPGGSTGGEAVLLLMGGSPLGWGTDIGGSVRIPSSMTGMVGFKPTSSRLPYANVEVSTDGQEHVPSAVGPMSTTVGGVVTAMKAVLSLDMSHHDPRCPPITWREERFQSVFGRKLRIGVLRDDGVVRPHPPIARALDAAVEKLRAAGHEIVEWDGEYIKQGVDVMDEYYRVDGGEDIRRAIEASGEPYLPRIKMLVEKAPALSVYEYWQVNKEKWDLRQKYLKKWNDAGIDFLLSPVTAHTAAPHRCFRWIGYTKFWNVMDYPAGTMCVDEVREEDKPTQEWKEYKPRNWLDEWNYNLYDHENMKGHKVELQIIGRRLEEEMTLGAMKRVEEIIKA
ncbi:Similar to Acetamidase; acc. no. Q12559 [Pyronema omphalodes CBS 100304]|uniref:Similar to Acetamidase acc. no. Q12559 n=1 Tax=Pyronema omphalodes (strain CBS 100304) TaxID=1076935 RepID=U4L5U9_PYROM|nr:Similar to Acetamidase; acc. no. Q12559 [Pyronema omphalodes CBS 100304]